MIPAPIHQILVAERLRQGILITFGDGKCAFYSADLLYAHFLEAEEIFETNDEV
jgi:hypothetical protein